MRLLSRHKNIKLHNEWWCFSSSHTHSHLHDDDVYAFVWLPCHKESKESKENSNWIELIDTFSLQRNFYFSWHTHTNYENEEKESMMTMQLLMIKIEILSELNLQTLRHFLDWNSFVRHVAMFNFQLHAEDFKDGVEIQLQRMWLKMRSIKLRSNFHFRKVLVSAFYGHFIVACRY